MKHRTTSFTGTPRVRTVALGVASSMALAMALGAGASPASAQGKGPGGYPLKPVRFIVPFAPGGTTDLIARMIGNEMSEAVGQQWVVDNRGGAGGTIAADIVARASGDGYTIMLNHQGMAFNKTLYPKLPFDTEKAFTGIALVGVTPNVLVVNNKVPVTTLKDLLTYAKTNKTSYGSGGVGSSAHISVALFARMAGVDLLHIPYKGAGPALADTRGGQIEMMIATMPAAAGFIRSGQLKALAVSGSKRSPAFPEIPTIAEAGVPGYAYDTWYAVLGPAPMQPTLVNWLNNQINAVANEPDMKARLAKSGLEVDTGTPERLQKLLASEIVRWGKAITEAGIKVQ